MPESSCMRSVHPRAGGEHLLVQVGSAYFIGSSPRGRGTPLRSRRAWRCPTVHPRAGGEHDKLRLRLRSRSGSSPRGRGTPPPGNRPESQHRFIPARAGNTAPRAECAPVDPVHPRAGGEHPVTTPVRRSSNGSSPRGRGTHRRNPRVAGIIRFIPARAGNTSDQRSRYG